MSLPTSDNISVNIRIRPLNTREKLKHKTNVLKIDNNNIIISNGTDVNVNTNNNTFSYDNVYDESINTEIVYNTCTKKIVHSVMNGINGTLFAYGQTSSGKTHTVHGNTTAPGIIPLSITDIFTYIKNTPSREFLMKVSFLEIYQENLHDLLVTSNNNIELKISEHYEKGIFVDGLTEISVESPQQVLELLSIGQNRRNVGSTAMNNDSSRSHSIFKIIIESREVNNENSGVKIASLHLVDLAGSERVSSTKATGVRLKEGGGINRSLHFLSEVIHALSEKKTHIPYRNSKLTRILQPALGGNTKTVIICNVTQADMHLEETLSTLSFASRAKKISNSVTVNEVIDDQTQIKKLKAEIQSLKQSITSTSSDAAQESKLNDAESELQKLRKFVLTSSSLSSFTLPTESSVELSKKKRRATCLPSQFNGNDFFKPIATFDSNVKEIAIIEEEMDDEKVDNVESNADLDSFKKRKTTSFASFSNPRHSISETVFNTEMVEKFNNDKLVMLKQISDFKNIISSLNFELESSKSNRSNLEFLFSNSKSQIENLNKSVLDKDLIINEKYQEIEKLRAELGDEKNLTIKNLIEIRSISEENKKITSENCILLKEKIENFTEKTSLVLENQQLTSAADAIKSESESRKTEVEFLESQLEQLKRDIKEKSETIADLEEQNDVLTQQSSRSSFYVPKGGVPSSANSVPATISFKDLEKLKAKLESSDNKNKQLQTEKAAIASEKIQLDLTIKKLNKQILSAEKEVEKVKSLQTAKIELTQALKVVEKKNDSLQKQVDKLTEELDEISSEKKELENAFESFKLETSTANSNMKIEIMDLSKALTRTEEMLHDESKKKSSFEQACFEYEQSLQAAENLIGSNGEEMRELKLQIESLSSELEIYTNNCSNLETELKIKHQELDEKNQFIEDLSNETIIKDKEYEELDKYYHDYKDLTSKEIEDFKSKANLVADEIQYLKSQNDEYISLNIKLTTDFEFSTSELKNNITTINDLSSQLSQLESQLEASNSNCSKLQMELTGHAHAYSELKSLYDEINEKYTALTSSSSEANILLAEMTAQKQNLSKQFEDSMKLHTQVQEKLKNSLAESMKNIEVKQALQRQVDSLTDEIATLNSKIEHATHEANERKLQMTQFAAALDTEKLYHLKDSDALKTVTSQLSEKNASFALEKESFETLILDLKSDHENYVNNLIETNRKDVADLKQQLHAAKCDADSMTFKISSLQDELDKQKSSITGQTNILKQENSIYSVKINQLASTIAQLQEDAKIMMENEQELEKSVEKHKNNTKDALSKIANYKKTDLTFKAEIEKMKVVLENLVESNKTLTESMDQLKLKNGTLDAECEKYKNENLELLNEKRATILKSSINIPPTTPSSEVKKSCFADNPEKVLKKLVMATRNVYKNKVSFSVDNKVNFAVDKENILPN